jgi:hypothetical protein
LLLLYAASRSSRLMVPQFMVSRSLDPSFSQ